MLTDKCGVYWVYNLVNGLFYVGSTSVSFKSRWKCHKDKLRKGIHANTHLQRAWLKHGEAAFLFEVVEVTPADEAVVAEQRWLDLLLPFEDAGYNLCREARSVRGIKRRPETLIKMSIARRGKLHTQETKDLLSRLAKNMSADVRRKIGDAHRGRSRSPEAVAKAAAKMRGRKHTPESRAKMSAVAKAAITPELRRKRSLSVKNRPQSWIEDLRAKALSRSAETSAFQKTRFSDPEVRRLHGEKVRAGKARAKAAKQETLDKIEAGPKVEAIDARTS